MRFTNSRVKLALLFLFAFYKDKLRVSENMKVQDTWFLLLISVIQAQLRLETSKILAMQKWL
jgi:hypothetical protein